MAARYEVTDAALGETVNFGDGEMNKYVLTLKDQATGQVTADVALWKPVGKEAFFAGDVIEGELQNQPRGGLKIKGARKAGGSAPATNGAAPAASSGSSSSRERSIERQVALKAAAQIVAAVASAKGQVPDASTVADLAVGIDQQVFNVPAPVPEPVPAAAVSTNPDDDIPF